MYITEISLQDLRSFKGKHAVSLMHADGSYAGWTVFAGRNGAGKSTLLKALALTAVGPLTARSLAGVFTDWVRHEEGIEAAYVYAKLSFDAKVDNFQTGGRTRKQTSFWTGLQWRRNEHGPDILESASGIPKTTANRGPWADTPRGWFVAGYGPYRHLGPAPAEVIKLAADPVVARLINLFNESATLSEAVDWLKQVHLRALEARAGAAELKADVLAVLGDGLLPDGSSVREVNSEGLWIERDGVRMPLEQVSDGYRTVAALVVELLRRLHDAYGALNIQQTPEGTRCDLPGVVLVDEVDAHMHVAWQQVIGFWLTSRFPNIQFLVTTHSPFICQAADQGGLIRLPGPGEARTIECVDEAVWRQVVNGGADDAVLSELFGLPYAHSERVEKLERELAELEKKVLLGNATADDELRYAELKTNLSDDLATLAERKLNAIVNGAC